MSMEQSGDSTQLEVAKPKLPKIEYSESISRIDCPYTVEVDREGAGTLLQLSGVPEEHMGGITIILDRKPSRLSSNLGAYYQRKKTIILYIDHFWKQQQRTIKHAEEILSRREEKSPNISSKHNQFPNLGSGKRLSWYLKVAPPERARATVERLTATHAQKKIISTLAHESKHAADLNDQKLSKTIMLRMLYRLPLAIATGIAVYGWGNYAGTIQPSQVLAVASQLGMAAGLGLGSLEILYMIDPLERSARRFAKESKYASITPLLTLTPKNANKSSTLEVK